VFICRSNATKESSSNPNGPRCIASSRFALLAMTKRNYWVYILASCRNGTLYVGVTNSLERRLWQHRNKTADGFTSKYSVDRLVYFEDFRDIENAIAREKRLKSGSRAKKIALIESVNPEWKDLSEGWFS
jgi:putative endonuclease